MQRGPGRPPKREIFAAVESFTAHLDGVDVIVRLGDTTETNSDLLVRYPHLFERINVTFPAKHRVPDPERVEQATAAPGETRW